MSFDVLYPPCFILFVFFPFSAMAQTYRNMSLGSSLTAQNDNSASWQSPSGEFAFGFRQIGNDGFLLAIWFNKIPDKTVVWSANGNSLVAQGSKVELTADGHLLLNDIAIGNDTFVASVGTGIVANAAMLDTGNFVLAKAHSNGLWESFGHPTDTILPPQTINQGSRLYAPYTSTNLSHPGPRRITSWARSTTYAARKITE
ncbi:G-type lectin S-receptor-like serine/threonine-protein kinase RLK1 [Malus sylvestris]|uniref:G-type lectin S-receptor-like serine/threonine-protein kinase RLK1 n=1 Tax=Malus sylvestris TaxID=3752 RepID=UPI0021AC45AF|nr:G-type lectin S-receptor-like serine/threonine-protein kinase RLK1 [Malus sylvestris]